MDYDTNTNTDTDTDKNLNIFKLRWNRLTAKSLKSIDSLDIQEYDKTEIKSCLILIFKELRCLHVKTFYYNEDMILIYYIIEFSLKVISLHVKVYTYQILEHIYELILSTLKWFAEFAEILELYEITHNLLHFIRFFKKQTFDFKKKKYIYAI